jgi:hypothetical protein
MEGFWERVVMTAFEFFLLLSNEIMMVDAR